MKILESIQKIAVKKIGREITPTDIQLFKVLHNSSRFNKKADNGLFDDDMMSVIFELQKLGHIKYDGYDIVIMKSFYPFMTWMIENAATEEN
jgi:hypothetical protein